MATEADLDYGRSEGESFDEDQEFLAEYAVSQGDPGPRTRSADAVVRRAPRFEDLKAEYSDLWTEMAIRRDRLPAVDSIVGRVVRNKETYLSVERQTRVPWFVVAAIHDLEAGGNFTRHLHNGDPLTARTVHVPAGRPATGSPPFTWAVSAADALAYRKLTEVTDWSIEHLAYVVEGYNGWGYRLNHPQVKSPYLWSFSNHYTKGKYVADGKWSETAVSQQCGAMVLLKRLEETGHIELQSPAIPDGIEHDSFRSDLQPGSAGDLVGALQALLRGLEFDLVVDLFYGPATELAVKVFQRHHGLRSDGVVGPMTWVALEDATPAASVVEPPPRYWPVGRGHVITSPWGQRPGGFHYGTDFGFPGGSADKPVYAVQSGTVQFAGKADGYGGPDPAGWLVIDSSRAEGGGCVEYGHIIREVAKGAHVTAGQRIARINPSSRTNGGVPPHLHLAVMPRGYDPRTKMNPIPWLGDALSPEAVPLPPSYASSACMD